MAGADKEIFSQLIINDCWVVGLERYTVGPAGEEEEFFEIRAEWSDKSITYLRRRYQDVVKLVKNLSNSFPNDRGHLLLEGLQRIKEAEESSNVETRLDGLEKLLRNITKMPQKFSQSEAVLTFFKTSPLDYMLKTMYQPVQPLYQSPVTVTDVRRANGFCLANTETVIFDPYLLAERAKLSSKYRSDIESQVWTGTRIQNGVRYVKETVHKPSKSFMNPGATESKNRDCQPKKSQNTNNMTYLHLQACETDILE